jgi:hypothetical protein
MIEVSRFFWKNSPEPLIASSIEKKLDLPSSWIVRSLDLLDEKGLVRKVHSNSNIDSYIPARPLEKYTVQEFYNLFDLDPRSQLERAQDSISKEGLLLVEKLSENAKEKPTMKLVEFLESI